MAPAAGSGPEPVPAVSLRRLRANAPLPESPAVAERPDLGLGYVRRGWAVRP